MELTNVSFCLILDQNLTSHPAEVTWQEESRSGFQWRLSPGGGVAALSGTFIREEEEEEAGAQSQGGFRASLFYWSLFFVLLSDKFKHSTWTRDTCTLGSKGDIVSVCKQSRFRLSQLLAGWRWHQCLQCVYSEERLGPIRLLTVSVSPLRWTRDSPLPPVTAEGWALACFRETGVWVWVCIRLPRCKKLTTLNTS